jgi:serine/threonine protein kinase
MLDALQLAHDNAMVHRDVKPENIFLHRGPTGTVTKLLDFGIVRMLNREATLTRGKFIGTLKYSSPEQISGTRPVGPSSDIYSMGIVLYELLAQRGPFDDLHDGFKIGAAHVEKPPPPPSQFAPVDPMVERLVLQALEKDPAARPASAGGFAAELRRALELFEAMPSQATDVELLSARHPIDLATAPTTLDGPATVAEPAVGRREVMADTVKAEPARPPLDREAPTRIQGKSDPRVIVAPNDTQVGAGLPRGATLRMPDASARASDTGPGELGPKRTQRFVTTVTTRPKPQSRAAVAVVVAAILAIAMIAGAIVIVRGRFGGK